MDSIKTQLLMLCRKFFDVLLEAESLRRPSATNIYTLFRFAKALEWLLCALADRISKCFWVHSSSHRLVQYLFIPKTHFLFLCDTEWVAVMHGNGFRKKVFPFFFGEIIKLINSISAERSLVMVGNADVLHFKYIIRFG
jgi:hypothetical protein